ncbi:MAG: hypothetical protein R3A44_00055 [Caldilineaceae bacterium]
MAGLRMTGGAVQSGIDTSSVQATLRDHNGNLVSGPQAVTFTTGPQWQSTHDLGLKQPAGVRL